MNDINVKIIRKKLNLTQEKFAKLIGVSKNTVLNYEKGRKIPDSKITILHNLIDQYEENTMVNEQITNYGIPTELTLDPVEDLRNQIYLLKDKLKDKEEIITLLKDKLKQYE